jgi:hypothetical protein
VTFLILEKTRRLNRVFRKSTPPQNSQLNIESVIADKKSTILRGS